MSGKCVSGERVLKYKRMYIYICIHMYKYTYTILYNFLFIQQKF